MHNPLKYQNPYYEPVYADACVREDKEQEKTVVVCPNALIQPYAVVVEFIHAHVAETAVL